ncbi:MAG TPA: histidine kinase, partial [Bryobacterales bacterium]|nr:histidine kinase [Bryobacterales bacterium]
MSSPIDQPQSRASSVSRSVGYVLGANLAVAVAVVLALMLLFGEAKLLELRETLIVALIYSNCIGTLAWLLLPRLMGRCARYNPLASWPLYLFALLALGTIGALLSSAVFFVSGILPPGPNWQNYYVNGRLALLVTLIVGLGVRLYESMRRRLEAATLELRTRELEKERALKHATAARLASLESRIHPHFLFNTLNSISTLIPEDPQRAERLVERLASLLRFSLDSGGGGLVPLRQELKIVTDYLEIEKARFGGRLSYSIEAPDELGSLEVPPLSLQTLVENSVKYAIAPRPSGGRIRVAARSDGGR